MSETLLSPQAAPAAPAAPAPGEAAPAIIETPAERDWTKAITPDGTFEAKAHEYGIPEHLKSIGGMWDSYQNIQRMKGAPGAEATPEQVTAFRQANSIPEIANAEAYGVQLPEELVEAYPPEALNEIVKSANESAHLGHTEMLKAVISKFGEIEMEGLGKLQEATAAEKAAKLDADAKALEADPNFAGERKTASLQTAANGLNASLTALGEDPNSEAAQDIARNPLMVRIIHHFASKTMQDSTNLGSPISDLRSAEEQANDIIENPANPLYKAYHEGDPIAGKKVLDLMGAS